MKTDDQQPAPSQGALALPAVLRPVPPPAPPDAGSPIATSIPLEVAKQLLWLPHAALTMGINVVAGRGSGKSRLMGRVIAWQALLRGEGLVIFDPIGGTINNLLDKILQLPENLQEEIWPRVVYVDLAGGERVVPLPLYYRLGGESYYEIAARFSSLAEKLDGKLAEAPILGLSALNTIASNCGMVLSALGLQITEASDLLARPEHWVSRLRQASDIDPLVAEAARFFLHQYPHSGSQRERMTTTFLAKVEPLGLDPVARAMFGAGTPGINWPDVVSKGQIVLFDQRREKDQRLGRFKLMAAFCYLLEFIKHRGRTRSGPLNVIIDELAYLAQARGGDDISPFDREFNDLCNTWMRQGKIHLTCAYQEAYQLSRYTRDTTMSLGTQVMGVTADMETALSLARQYFPVDPWRVKALREGSRGTMEPVYLNADEQHYLAAEYFKGMRLFEFLVRPAAGEGDIRQHVYPITIKNFDQGQWPDDARIEATLARLRQTTGVPVAQILAQIEERRPQMPPKRARRPVKMEEDDDTFGDPIPR